MTGGLRIRAAESEDFEVVAELLEALGRAAVTDETRERCRAIFDAHVASSEAGHLVAVDEGTDVVGFCSLHFRERLNYASPDAWVPDLFVAEPARRRGAGRLLLEQAERHARHRGCLWLMLESGYDRTDAHRLYAEFGMRDAGKYFVKPLV